MGNLINNGLYTSATEEWETPPAFFEAINAEYNFTLDPACTEENHKCPKFYTKKEDGLQQDWGGERVYINPPYGRQIVKWIEKAEAEAKKPDTLCVLLLPARTDTAWFHDHIAKNAKIYFIRGRLRFNGSNSNAPFPSMLAVYDNRVSRLTGWSTTLESGISLGDTPEERARTLKTIFGNKCPFCGSEREFDT